MNDFIMQRFNGLTAAVQWLTGRDCLDQAAVVGGASCFLWTIALCIGKSFWLAGAVAIILVGVFVEVQENGSIRKDAMRGLRNKRLADISNLIIGWFWVAALCLDVFSSIRGRTRVVVPHSVEIGVDTGMVFRYFGRCCDPLSPSASLFRRVVSAIGIGGLETVKVPEV